jgi:structural maintenance of chromosome 4
MITLGGNAELELVDSMDPFSEGIIFSVMPPKKSWKNISNLSGGEKTLSSLALVFALHHFKVRFSPPAQLISRINATNNSPLLCTLWMRSTPHLISETYRLSQTTSRTAPRTLSLLLYPFGTSLLFDPDSHSAHPLFNRNDMFELSHRLIGIYKTANTTKSQYQLKTITTFWLKRDILGISINNHALLARPTKVSDSQRSGTARSQAASQGTV